jgi:hypothetical protein
MGSCLKRQDKYQFIYERVFNDIDHIGMMTYDTEDLTDGS